MKKTVLGIAALLAVCVAVLGAGCIGGSDPIVGEWKINGMNVPVVFNDDGTGYFTVSAAFAGSEDIALNWAGVEGLEKTYMITITGKGNLGYYTMPGGEYTISDDGKTLTGRYIIMSKVVE